MILIAPRISVDPAVCFGKPVIVGSRVPVSVVVGSIAAGDSFEDVARDYALTYPAKRLEEDAV